MIQSDWLPTETKFGISLVLFAGEKLTWSTIGDILYLSVVAGRLKLSERKMTCLNLEKCNLSLTPLAGIFHGKPMALLSTI